MALPADYDEIRDYDYVEDCPYCGWCDECARYHHDPCSWENEW